MSDGMTGGGGETEACPLRSLREVVRSSETDEVREEALDQLYSLSQSHKENEEMRSLLIDQKEALVEIIGILVDKVSLMSEKTLLVFCQSLRALSLDKNIKNVLGLQSCLLNFLHDNIKALSYEIRRTCSETIMLLSWSESNQNLLSELPGFHSEVCDLILQDNCDVRPQLISMLGNLARGGQKFREWIVSDNDVPRKVLELLVEFVVDVDKHVQNITPYVSQHEGCTLILKEYSSLLQVNSCAFLANVAYLKRGAQFLCGAKRDFITHLVNIVDPEDCEHHLQHSAFLTLSNLAGTESGIQVLLTSEYNLVSTAVYLLCNKRTLLADYRQVVVIRFLWGLASLSSVKSTIVLKHQDIIPELLDIVQSRNKNISRSKVWAIRLLVRLAESSNVDVIAVLLSCETHAVFLNILQSVCELPMNNWKSNDGHIQYMLSFIMTLSRHQLSIRPLKNAHALDIMEPILLHHTENGSEALKAMITTALLIGRDENKSNILHARPEIITLIVDVLDRTLNSQHGPVHNDNLKPEYRFGTFRLHLLLRAILVMSVSDANKVQLVQSERLIYLLSERVIGLYLENAAEIPSPPDSIQPGVGGGNDVESAELAIETLLQLSFASSNDDGTEVTTLFAMEGDEWLLNSLDALLCDSESVQYRKLSHEGIRNIICLRSRLASVVSQRKNCENVIVADEKPRTGLDTSFDSAATTVSATSTPGALRHVMISYCWNEEAKPEIVKELADQLRDTYGYDVWRDEDGSDLLSPMRGSTIEHMAKAVEMACIVIVCASRQYKESANCRMEAVYAHQRQLKNKVEIIYVMLQENYTTKSGDEACDGWLGMMVGEKLWYPLFDSSMVASASESISKHISGNTTVYKSCNRQRVSNPRLMTSKSDVSAFSCGGTSCYDEPPRFNASKNVLRENIDNTQGQCSSPMSDSNQINDNKTTLMMNSFPSTPKNGSNGHINQQTANYTPARPRLFDLPRQQVSHSTGGEHACDGISIHDDAVQEAFDCLTDPRNSLIPYETNRVLSVLGIRSMTDLTFLDVSDLEILAGYLKLVPSRRFLSKLQCEL